MKYIYKIWQTEALQLLQTQQKDKTLQERVFPAVAQSNTEKFLLGHPVILLLLIPFPFIIFDILVHQML